MDEFMECDESWSDADKERTWIKKSQVPCYVDWIDILKKK